MQLKLNKDQAEKLGLKEGQKIKVLNENGIYGYGLVISTDNGNIPIFYGIGKTEEDAINDGDNWLENPNWKKEEDWWIEPLNRKAYEYLKKYGDYAGDSYDKILRLNQEL